MIKGYGLTMINDFYCISCGACCKNIKGIEELKSFDRGNGICKYLNTHNHLCTIYQNRPDICRIDVMFEKVYFKHYTKEAFYSLNKASCKILQEKEALNHLE